MRVEVTVNNQTFFVPCGDGQQSLRWLSLVSAQQYSLRSQPKGRARYREPTGSKVGFFLPSGMSSGKGEALRDPNAKIADVFNDGAQVTCTLQETVEVDSIGAPIQSDWQQRSFCQSAASQLRMSAEAARREEEKKRAAERGMLEKDARNRKGVRGMSAGATVQEFDIDVVSASASADMPLILEIISESSRKDQDELESYLPTIFPILSNIFAHYVGGKTQEGGEGTMTFAEFSHFVHAARVDHAYRDSDVARDYVRTTKRKLGRNAGSLQEAKGGADEDEDFMTRAEFVACCVVVALAKTEGTMRSADSMKNFLVKFIQPGWLEGREEDQVRVLIDGRRTSTMLAESRPYLKNIFERYTGDANGVMTESCFLSLMKDAGLLMRHPGEDTGAAEKRMASLAGNSFFGAQGFPPRHLELNELVFAEFVEATCRLALESLSATDDKFSRVQLGVDALLDLRRTMR
ncbi:hypothetical protein TeGR_g1933 [Tetraparma gracilis]|jgi:hypothetical protein|uniref:EF-hand domain-containing protein n=1 Tax=Tetraparma gracilis TaxID=2962635 RepID=A0ABQ6N531_9STRA|nr:hypothetical protein TeGR_g1933 [Tetraparma gracilis]